MGKLSRVFQLCLSVLDSSSLLVSATERGSRQCDSKPLELPRSCLGSTRVSIYKMPFQFYKSEFRTWPWRTAKSKEFLVRHRSTQKSWEVDTASAVLLTKVTALYRNCNNKDRTRNRSAVLSCLDMTTPYYSFCFLGLFFFFSTIDHAHKILKSRIKADRFLEDVFSLSEAKPSTYPESQSCFTTLCWEQTLYFSDHFSFWIISPLLHKSL